MPTDSENHETTMPGATGTAGSGPRIAEQGECLESIAAGTGFFWKTLWEAPENKELRDKRQEPTALLPGDGVFIPELRIKHESRPTEKRHRFTRKGIPARLRVVLRDADGNPRAGVDYRVVIDGVEQTGATDGDGVVDVPLPPHAQEGVLHVGEGEEYQLSLRQLDPATEPTGLQARLRNLGYYFGPIDGILGSLSRTALAAFQRDHGLNPTGKIDAESIDKLKEVHGG